MNKKQIMQKVLNGKGKAANIDYTRENLKNVVELDDEYKVVIDDVFEGFISIHVPDKNELRALKQLQTE